MTGLKESELEADRGEGLDDPSGLDRLVRRLRYEAPEVPGAPVVFEVEDFVASWASRKSARSLADALRGVWLLRMSARTPGFDSIDLDPEGVAGGRAGPLFRAGTGAFLTGIGGPTGLVPRAGVPAIAGRSGKAH